jgi:hypothetical protein
MDIYKTEYVGKTTAEPSRQLCRPIVELRQYTLHPGKRDVLLALFERAFIEAQQAESVTRATEASTRSRYLSGQ